ncbi:hypothetical protein WS63_31345 [Burkholderia stagnalis]|nr:hypothetical protein WS63_31345 [Burkholderia stagnalis]
MPRRASASITVSMPLRGTRQPSCSTTNASSGQPSRARAAARGTGRNSSASKPHGTMASRFASARYSVRRSSASCGHSAISRSARRASVSSIATRASGKPSAAPWRSRLTRPSAWNVTTNGMPSRRFTRSATSPDVKKFACIRSTVAASRRSRAITSSANAPMYGSSRSLGTSAGGPAGTWITRIRAPIGTTSGRCGLSRRLQTSTSSPRSASCVATRATQMFCPPASTPPITPRGDAWSLINAILCTMVAQSIGAARCGLRARRHRKRCTRRTVRATHFDATQKLQRVG